jgi:hypothetical protein
MRIGSADGAADRRRVGVRTQPGIEFRNCGDPEVARNSLWRRGVLGTAVLTVVVNAASAAAGMVYILVSLGFLASEDRSLMVGFLWASPLLIFAATVTAEYLTGTRLFKLPRSWKTMAIFTAANINIPSVGLYIYGTLWLTAKEFAKGGY